MLKREIRRIQRRLSPFMDPLAIVALILVILLPTVAVLNLSPLSKEGIVTNKRVLGEMDGKPLGVVLVGGIHQYIKEENIDFPSELNYEYTAVISPHEKGRYSKPVFQIVNDNSTKKEIELLATLDTPSQTEVSFILGEKEFQLVSRKGEPFSVIVPIQPRSEDIAYLKFYSDNTVQFSNHITLQIFEK